MNTRRQQAAEIRVEELVLYGFDPVCWHGMEEAIEHQLARLLDEHGLSPVVEVTSDVTVDGSAFKGETGALAEAISIAVARAVRRGSR